MGRFRDAITGLFTTQEHAQANPDTTLRETLRPPVRGQLLELHVEMECGCRFALSHAEDLLLRGGHEISNFINHAAAGLKHRAVIEFQQHRCPRAPR